MLFFSVIVSANYFTYSSSTPIFLINPSFEDDSLYILVSPSLGSTLILLLDKRLSLNPIIDILSSRGYEDIDVEAD